jgi:hypothetical protein
MLPSSVQHAKETSHTNSGLTQGTVADGVIEESGVMGRTLTIPAEPRHQGIDVSVGASGWEPLRTYLARRRG